MNFHSALILQRWSPAEFVFSAAISHSVAAQVSQGPLQSSRTLADSLLVSLADQSLLRLRAQSVYSSDLMADINKPWKPHSH